jgi:hypothetical protein
MNERISGNVVSLDAVRERRRYIALALSNDSYRQTKASFALSDYELDDDDAERIGRVLAGVMTHEQAIAEIVRMHVAGTAIQP